MECQEVGASPLSRQQRDSSIDRVIRIYNMIKYFNYLNTSMDGLLASTYILNSISVPSGMFSVSFNNYTFNDSTRWSL